VLNQHENNLDQSALAELCRLRKKHFCGLTERARVVQGNLMEWLEYWKVCQRTIVRIVYFSRFRSQSFINLFL
jgi:hypothetical protein